MLVPVYNFTIFNNTTLYYIWSMPNLADEFKLRVTKYI